jgi:hypothetical protein
MTWNLVLIPCRLDRWDAKSALIEDADGFLNRVVGPLGRVNGRLVVTANWLREANGRHRVRFACGTEFWVVYGPRPDIDCVRFGSTAPAGSPASPLTAPTDAGLPGMFPGQVRSPQG